MNVEDAPRWIKALVLLFRRFPTSDEDLHFSAVIAPPSAPYFAATTSLTALELYAENVDESVTHGRRVTTIVGNQFRDVTFHENPFRLDGSTFAEGKTPPIRALPENFPDRKGRTISAESSELLVELDGSVDALKPNWELLRASGNPVLVICTRPKVIADKLRNQLADFGIWNPIQKVAAAEPGQLVTEWFRSPIILASPSGMKGKSWLSELKPRVVINVGMTTWQSRFRWIWPETPHVLLLEPTSDDVFLFRDWFADRQVNSEPQEILGFEGVPGLPIKLFAESPGIFSEQDEFDEIEDEYA